MKLAGSSDDSVSIHRGSNRGYQVHDSHIRFAHDLIDLAGVDMIYGLSFHLVRSIEVYNNRPVISGYGDFFNDYAGIRGTESCREDLTLMYFTDINPESGELEKLQLLPLQIRNKTEY